MESVPCKFRRMRVRDAPLMCVMRSSGPLGSHALRHTDLLLLLGGLFEEVSLKCSSLEIRNNESYFSSLAVKTAANTEGGKVRFMYDYTYKY